jgi:hypothetical protein
MDAVRTAAPIKRRRAGGRPRGLSRAEAYAKAVQLVPELRHVRIGPY